MGVGVADPVTITTADVINLWDTSCYSSGEVTYWCRSQQPGGLVMPLILGHMDLNADKDDGY